MRSQATAFQGLHYRPPAPACREGAADDDAFGFSSEFSRVCLGPDGSRQDDTSRQVEKDLAVGLAEQLRNEYERLPVVSVEAVAPESGNFSWREHFKRLLDAMREPAIDYKLSRKGKPGVWEGPFSPSTPPPEERELSTSTLSSSPYATAGRRRSSSTKPSTCRR